MIFKLNFRFKAFSQFIQYNHNSILFHIFSSPWQDPVHTYAQDEKERKGMTLPKTKNFLLLLLLLLLCISEF